MQLPRAREIETLLLTIFAAVPLYGTGAVGVVPLLCFHAVMLGIVARVMSGRSPEIIPSSVMRAAAMAYVLFYFVDAAIVSRSAIAASTHLVLFIAVYQPIESIRVQNYGQRLLTTALIFTASIATSTHISIVIFVVLFCYWMFRQMMYVSHIETIRSLGRDYSEPSSVRAAAFYLAGTMLIGAMLFPLLPRVRNPLVKGLTGPLTNATTGLSESIDFSENRTSTPDPTVVARVWMGAEAVPFFTPLRLRGTVYDRYYRTEWRQSRSEFREIRARDEVFRIARPIGFGRAATVQQRFTKYSRLLLPSGTFAVAKLPNVFEGPTHDAYLSFQPRGNELVTFEVGMARAISPLRPPTSLKTGYPVTPAVRALANKIVGTETAPDKRAEAIERYLLRNYQYVQRPEEIGHPMSVDTFLLKERRGHCEFFAAGMVALLTAVDVPARIVGGFYGGRLNPLTGYFVVRREDAHAWVESYDGTKWVTYDPTPEAMRPGNQQAGLLRMYAGAISDSISYFWDRYVLTYGLADQIALMADLFTRVRSLIEAGPRMAAAMARGAGSTLFLGLLAVAIAVIVGGMAVWRRNRPVFVMLAEELARYGIVVGPAMTMEEALAHLRLTHASVALDLEPLIRMYEAEQFSATQQRERRAAIRNGLARLRTTSS